MTDYEIVDDLMQGGKLNDKIAEWLSGDQELWEACCRELEKEPDVMRMVDSYRLNNKE